MEYGIDDWGQPTSDTTAAPVTDTTPAAIAAAAAPGTTFDFAGIASGLNSLMAGVTPLLKATGVNGAAATATPTPTTAVTASAKTIWYIVAGVAVGVIALIYVMRKR